MSWIFFIGFAIALIAFTLVAALIYSIYMETGGDKSNNFIYRRDSRQRQ